MNRADRKRLQAVAKGGDLDKDEMNALLASIAETLRNHMPGCDVTLIVDKPWVGEPTRSDIRYASTAEWPKVRALFKGMVETRGG